MNDIINYIEKNLKFESFNLKNDKDYSDTKNYYNNAKADAIHCYEGIKKFIRKDKNILEVGGGIHLLTSFLNQEYKITSVEPSGFTGFTDEIRNQVIKKNNLKVYTTTLEEFKTDEKFDFIFSMNVLEHTKNITEHLNSCLKLLKDDNSVIFIQCPNYTFPFEPHFYEFFIPFLPNFTFTKIKKRRLIKKLGEKRYNNTLKNLNFDCTYRNLKKSKLKIEFIHPVKDIFDRILIDEKFKNRILKHFFLKITYKFIKNLKLEKFICKVFPKFICPYIIFTLRK